MGEYDERAARGSRWLDDNEPGWEEKIYLPELDLSEPDACVCGQIGPGFYRYIFEKGLSGYRAHRLGFIIWERGEKGGTKEYASLTSAWKRLIRKRRKEQARAS